MEFQKADLGRRIVASIIDGIISGVVGLIPFVGGVIGFAYMLIKDGLLNGSSPGKKAISLKVVVRETGDSAGYAESVKRNIIFGIPSLIMIIPVIGLVVAPILALVVYILELYFIIKDPKGLRYGDHLAGTQVVSGS